VLLVLREVAEGYWSYLITLQSHNTVVIAFFLEGNICIKVALSGT